MKKNFIKINIFIYDNYGISGVEKFFDRELKDQNLINQPLKITLDANIQYLISKELNKSLNTFNASGGGALLMNVEMVRFYL